MADFYITDEALRQLLTVTGRVKPDPPTSLALTVVSTSRIDLSWSYPVSAEYAVWRSTGGGAFAEIAAGLTDLSYSDTGLTASTTYTYYVTATIDVVPSDPSNVESETTDAAASPPAIPTGLTVGTVTSSNISLDWDDNAEPNITGYRVYRSTDDANFSVVGNPSASSYTDTGLSPETLYYYRVTALNDNPPPNDESAQTTSVNATTLAAGTDPYDLSGFSIGFAINWPVEPNTTTTFNVPADGSFATAISVSGRLVNVAAGYSGAGGTMADDVDVVMDNTATITSPINHSNNSRHRITGGNITGSATNISADGCSDVLYNNVNVTNTAGGNCMNMNVSGSGSAGFSRVAFINCSFQLGLTANGVWALFTRQSGNPPPGINTDLIVANCDIDGDTYQPVRVQGVVRHIHVDTFITGGSGFRGHEYSQDWHVENLVIDGYLNWANKGGSAVYSVQGAEIRNVHAYSGNRIFHLSLNNTGTVYDSVIHHTATQGNGIFLDGLTDGGGNSETTWDGASIDFTTVPGKTSRSDFGADH